MKFFVHLERNVLAAILHSTSDVKGPFALAKTCLPLARSLYYNYDIKGLLFLRVSQHCGLAKRAPGTHPIF